MITKIEKIKSKIYLKTNKSPIILFFRILFSILFVDIFLILIFLFVDFTDIETKINFFSIEELIIIFGLSFHLFFFLYLFIYWFFNFYEIKDGKVSYTTGILFKKKNIFIIEEINSLEIFQSFLARIFDYGDIMIYYNEKEFKLKNVPHPKEFIDFIEVLKIEE